jgi:hypothetical protein
MALKPNQPSEEQRNRVKALAGLGLSQENICDVIGLRSPKTLRKRFRRELAEGFVEANSKVRQTAFQLAMSGRDPRSTMFWLRTRLRWCRPMDEDRVIEKYVIEDYEFSEHAHGPEADDPLDY